MGKEAKLRKARKCKGCGQTKFATAEEFKWHVQMCERAAKLGLVLPGVTLE